MARTLIVYYSRSGNTRFVADEIAKNLQAETEELLELKNRPGMIGYLLAGRDSVRGKKSEIHPTKKNPAEYDLIFLGTPNWAYNITPALRSYLTKFNLEGKRVAIFTTQDSSGAEKVFNSIRRLIPKAEIVSEKYFNQVLQNSDKVKGEIALWLNKIYA